MLILTKLTLTPHRIIELVIACSPLCRAFSYRETAIITNRMVDAPSKARSWIITRSSLAKLAGCSPDSKQHGTSIPIHLALIDVFASKTANTFLNGCRSAVPGPSKIALESRSQGLTDTCHGPETIKRVKGANHNIAMSTSSYNINLNSGVN